MKSDKLLQQIEESMKLYLQTKESRLLSNIRHAIEVWFMVEDGILVYNQYGSLDDNNRVSFAYAIRSEATDKLNEKQNN